MEPENNKRENRRESRVIIKSPLRLAIFSVAILMLAAFAMRLIAEGSPVVSGGAF
jgi:hypothetical protein